MTKGKPIRYVQYIYIYTCKLCVCAFVNIETQRDGERERDGILHMHCIYSKYISYLHMYIYILLYIKQHFQDDEVAKVTKTHGTRSILEQY